MNVSCTVLPSCGGKKEHVGNALALSVHPLLEKISSITWSKWGYESWPHLVLPTAVGPTVESAKQSAVSTNSPKSLSSLKTHWGISTAAHCKTDNQDAHGCSYKLKHTHLFTNLNKHTRTNSPWHSLFLSWRSNSPLDRIRPRRLSREEISQWAPPSDCEQD